MAIFTAEEVFSTAPTVKTASEVGDVDVGGLIPGDEVYLAEQILRVIPPVASFDFNGGDNATVQRMDITGYNNAFTETSGYLTIIASADEEPAVQYSAISDEFRVAFFGSDGSVDQRATYSAAAGVQEAFLAGDVDFSIKADTVGNVVDYTIWVNDIRTFWTGGGQAPRYSSVLSTSFRDLDVKHTHSDGSTGNITFTDANIETINSTPTDLLGRKMYHDGEKLIDISAPSTIRYEAAVTKVYHNQTVLVGPLTEDITLDVDALATHFRVLYLEDTEVTNTMSLTFPNDIFVLGNAGDDVTFSKLSDDSWFYINERNNEKGIF